MNVLRAQTLPLALANGCALGLPWGQTLAPAAAQIAAANEATHTAKERQSHGAWLQCLASNAAALVAASIWARVPARLMPDRFSEPRQLLGERMTLGDALTMIYAAAAFHHRKTPAEAQRAWLTARPSLDRLARCENQPIAALVANPDLLLL